MDSFQHHLREEVFRLYEENGHLKAEVDRLKGKGVFLPETASTIDSRFTPVVHNLPIPALLVDLENDQIIDVNQAFTSLIAARPEQLIGQTIGESLFLNQPDSWLALLEGLRTTGNSQNSSLSLRNHHGEHLPLMISVREIRAGDKTRALFLLVDIRSWGNGEHGRSENRNLPSGLYEGAILQLLSNTLPVVVWTRDLDLRYTWFSHPIVYGISTDAILGKRDYDLLPNHLEAEKIENILRQVIDQKVTIRRDVEFHLQGRNYHLDLTAQPLIDENGKVTGVLAVTFDVSRMRQVEEKLRREEEHFHKVFQDAGLIAARIDRDLRYEWIHYPHPDFDPKTVIGKRDDELLGPEGAAEIMELKKEVLATGKVIRRELTVKLSKGLSYYDTTAIPYKDAQERIIGLTTTSVDVTAWKRAEEQLHDLHRDLEVIVAERLGQLRSLSRLMLITEQRERSKIAHVLQEHVQQMLVSTQMKVMSLLQDTSTLLPDLADRTLSIYDMLRESLKSLQLISAELSPPFVRSEGLDVALEWLAAYMRRLYGLEVSIRIVRRKRIKNDDVRLLVINIVRELLINVANHAMVDRVQVSVLTRGNSMVIQVEDEGKGFDVQHVMQDYSSSECIGLICAKQQLELFGGLMEISSSVGKGTRVSITVPVSEKVPD